MKMICRASSINLQKGGKAAIVEDLKDIAAVCTFRHEDVVAKYSK